MRRRAPAGTEVQVCICILNWNGWRDTIECLESIFRIERPAFRVVVIDNGSDDASVEQIRRWAAGELPLDLGAGRSPLGSNSPPVRNPIQVLEVPVADPLPDAQLSAQRLVILRSGENLGFAGGNNLALEHVLRAGVDSHVWLLNNDTVVDGDALWHLVQRMGEEPDIGLCGSTLLCYDDPNTVQALGGFRYNRWLGHSSKIGEGKRISQVSRELARAAESSMFGVQGASVLVSIPFLRRVGLLAEEYFLYFEEQDWAERARRNAFHLGYAPQSIVYHKEGRSTGNSGRRRSERSQMSDYFQVRSRILFTRKFYPYALPSVYLGLFGVLVNRIRRRQFGHARMIAALAVRMALSVFPGLSARFGVGPSRTFGSAGGG